jgi:hypothetical protein
MSKFRLHSKSWSRSKHKGPENILSSTVTQINKPFHKRPNAPCTRSVIQANDNFMLPEHTQCALPVMFPSFSHVFFPVFISSYRV